MRVAKFQSLFIALLMFAGAADVPLTALGQARPPLNAQAVIDNKQPVKLGPGPYRKLAPGVEQVIMPQIEGSERFSRHDIIEILTADPNFAEREYRLKDKNGNPKEPPVKSVSPAKNVRFQHDVWCLQFSFKPLRFREVDVPDSLGKMVRKQIWYMVYHVTNTGDKPVLFTPQFQLYSLRTKKIYPDRIIPVAIPEIRKREDPNRPLLNTVEMTREIPPAALGPEGDVWGVVTWEDIDPTTDKFSIVIRGLTNAYIWEDVAAGEPGAYKAGDPYGTGRTIKYKALELNFWRPSDVYHEHEDEIKFGTPGDVDYRWVFR